MPKTNVRGFIIYEESMPLERLIGFLTINHFAAVISPTHDKDTYTKEDVAQWRKSQEELHGVYIPEDAKTWERPTGEQRVNGSGQVVKVTETRDVPQVGALKKPHRHVYVMLDYSATLGTWLNLFAPLDIHYLEEIRSKRGYLRYLCHLDNPEKARYNIHDVIQLGGVDITCIYEKTQRDATNLELTILNVITANRCTSVGRLQRILLEEEKNLDAYREVKAHYGYWSMYMRNIYYVTSVEVTSEEPKRLQIDADGVLVEITKDTEEGGDDEAAAA